MNAGQAGYMFGTVLGIAVIVMIIVMAVKGTIKKEREAQAKKRKGKK